MKSFHDMMSMKGRVSLITGGAGYLGQAMAKALAEVGSGIVLVDIEADKARALASTLSQQFGIDAIGIGADLADESAVRAIPNSVAGQFGSLDVVINNAAYVGSTGLSGWTVPFEQQSSETWRTALEVNLTAAFNLTQVALPLLKASGHGSIINIASIYGMLGPDFRLYEGTKMGNPAAYAASKGGLIQFTKWCATALAPQIRVNAISPGGIYRNQPKEFIERYNARTPLARMAREDDFIGAIVYLASDLSAYVTGQNIVIDGGWSAW